MSIPLGKLGFYLPQTLTLDPTDPNEPAYLFRQRVKTFIANAAEAVTPGRPGTPSQPFRALALPIFNKSSRGDGKGGSPPNGNRMAQSVPTGKYRQRSSLSDIFYFTRQARGEPSGSNLPNTPPRSMPRVISGLSEEGRPSDEQTSLSPSSYERSMRSSGGVGGYGTIYREQV